MLVVRYINSKGCTHDIHPLVKGRLDVSTVSTASAIILKLNQNSPNITFASLRTPSEFKLLCLFVHLSILSASVFVRRHTCVCFCSIIKPHATIQCTSDCNRSLFLGRSVQLLLSQGACPDRVGAKGVAAIHLAVGKETEKNTRCLKMLLQYGADPNIR